MSGRGAQAGKDQAASKGREVLILAELQEADDFPLFRMATTFARQLQEKGFRCLLGCTRDSATAAEHFFPGAVSYQRLPQDGERYHEKVAELHRIHGFRTAALMARPQATPARAGSLTAILPFLVEVQWEPMSRAQGQLVLFPSFAASRAWQDLDPRCKVLRGAKSFMAMPAASLPTSGGRRLLVWLTKEPQKGSTLAALLARLRSLFEIHQVVDAQLLEKRSGSLPDASRDSFGLTLCDASPRCMELAAAGKPFLHFPQTTGQLTLSYAMEELGVAPGLGWLEGKTPEELAARVLEYREPKRWTPWVKTARRLCDGRGFERVFPLLIEREILPGFGMAAEQP
jgi:hypothetical protein